MNRLNKQITQAVQRPIRVMQYGEGNFLRGFVDYMIDVANEAGVFDGNVAIVKPIAFGDTSLFEAQECQYTVCLRGQVDGDNQVITRQITCVEKIVDAYEQYDDYMALAANETLRFVVSNTTEAGIVFDPTDCFDSKPAKTFPGKLTQFLHARYTAFSGEADKGLIMLPVELIDDNGTALKKCVMQCIEQWQLSDAFKGWVEENCLFCNTLVDRIITGYPKYETEAMWEQLGYQDELLVTGEPFGLWVIESERSIEAIFPLHKAGMPVVFTGNQKPYKERKVRILNGAHTSFSLASYLAGNDYVLESMNDPLIKDFMVNILNREVIPTLSLPAYELRTFTEAVLDRFANPFVKHELLAISLNSVSKWRARCMPSLLGYIKLYNRLPKGLTFSLAALIAFYHGREIVDGALIGTRTGETYQIRDDEEVLTFFATHTHLAPTELVTAFLGEEKFHGQDLTQIEGLVDCVAMYLQTIREDGMKAALQHYFN